MTGKRSETVGMVVHLGPFRPKEVQDDVRTTLRAVMSLQKRKLGKATISTKGDTMKVHGNGITISTHGKEGWIHLSTEIDSPVSTKRLAIANKYNNFIGLYLKEIFRGMMKVMVTITITENLATMELAKCLSPDMLREMDKALGFEVIPNGIWLISKAEGKNRSIIVTGYRRNYSIDFMHSVKTGNDIPENVLIEMYKKLKEKIPKSLSILQAG